MKVCLVNPKTDVMLSDSVFPPLGLWYISSALRAEGWGVVISDMAFGDAIPDDADAYGITGTSPQAGEMQKLVERIRTIKPDAWIIAGGPHATLASREVLDYGVDCVLCGEGDEAIVDIISGRWGEIVVPQRVKDLDVLPLPDRTQTWRYRYEIDNLPATMLMTSRGCPYQCAFCSKPLGKDIYMRSVEHIMEEVYQIKDELGFRAVMFVDDTLGIDGERLGRLCQELASVPITWRCLMRGEQVTPAIAQAMKEGGCVEVGIGIESGSDRILRNIQKGETASEIEQGIRWLKEAGIRVKGFFIIGLPGENRLSLSITEQFLESVPLDDVDICILNVYQGSPIYENPEAYDVQWVNGTAGYYKADPAKYECAVCTSALSSRELLEARQHLENRFKRWRT